MKLGLWILITGLLVTPFLNVAGASSCRVYLETVAERQKKPSILTNPKDLWEREGELLRSLSVKHRLKMSFPRLKPVMDEIWRRALNREIHDKITKWKNEGYEYGLALDIVELYLKEKTTFGEEWDYWHYLKIWAEEGFLVVPTFASLSPRTIARLSPYPIFPIGLNKDVKFGSHDQSHAVKIRQAWGFDTSGGGRLTYRSIEAASRYMEGLLERLDLESQRRSNFPLSERSRWENQKTFIYDLLFLIAHERDLKFEQTVLKDFLNEFSVDQILNESDITNSRLRQFVETGQMEEGTLPPHLDDFLRLTEAERLQFVGEAVQWLRTDFENYWREPSLLDRAKNWLGL